ncbi:MAG: vitamin K epoxide reductase family protein [Patescibacteria group bacterium]
MLNFIKKNYLVVIICIFAITGFLAAFTLSVEKLSLVKDASYVTSCSVNVVFDCGTVMKTEHAELFGFPNSFIGIAGWAMAFVTGLFLFQSRKTNRFLTWFTIILTFSGFLISYYWLYLSAYVIGVFCPWCLISTTSATAMFFAFLTLHLYENNFELSVRNYEFIKKKIDAQWNVAFVIFWFLAVIAFAYAPFFISTYL